MPYRLALTALALTTALALAGCNASQQPSASVAAAVPANGAPPDYRLPSGLACSGDINRYATIVYGDSQTGMVSTSVFSDIKGEIEKAADACRAGHDSEARALVSASQHRHGYPSSA